MLKKISILSLSTLLIACGGSGSTGGEDDTNFAPALGAGQASTSETRLLEVDKDFAFESSRTIDINFDISQAQDEEATVTICTDYETAADEYDVNFNSCSITGELSAGSFQHSMEITNDNDSVVAVVLFQNAQLDPLYKEFNVDNNLRTKRDGSGDTVIVWR